MNNEFITARIPLVDAGGTITLDRNNIIDFYILTGTPSLSSSLTITGTNQIVNTTFKVVNTAVITANISGVTIFGKSIPSALLTKNFVVEATWNGSSYDTIIYAPNDTNVIATANILDANVTLAKLEALTKDYIIVGNASNRPTAVTLQSAVFDVTDADIATAINNFAATVAEELIVATASFETDEVGTIKIKVPYDCVVTNIYANVSTTIAGTDDGSIELLDATGTQMTGSALTITMSSALGTGFNGAITANNTLSAGDTMSIVTSKRTAGGRLILSISLQRA